MKTFKDQRVTYEELEIIQHMQHIFLSNSCAKNRINRLKGLKTEQIVIVFFFVNLFCLNQAVSLGLSGPQ